MSDILRVGGTHIGPDQTYYHTQASSSATWTIYHGLARYPVVTVVNGSGQKVEPDITYTNANQIVITFAVASTGTAYLN